MAVAKWQRIKSIILNMPAALQGGFSMLTLVRVLALFVIEPSLDKSAHSSPSIFVYTMY